MFYPELIRSLEYKKKPNGENYSDYTVHREQVEQDCQYRCVYCDIKYDEAGFEGFHIDHFRPTFFFPDLRVEPKNLVIACAKCNILKSKDWPSKQHDSVVGSVGYLDPFENGRPSFFSINEFGEIEKNKDPVIYMIEMLALNRFSRVQVRRNRKLEYRYDEILDRVYALTQTINSMYERGEEVKGLLSTLMEVQGRIKEI